MRTSYIIAQAFIQTGIVGIILLILPYFGFVLGLSFLSNVVLLGTLATSKILVFMLMKMGLGWRGGFGRDFLSMVLTALITLGILMILGLAAFDLIGFVTIFMILLVADILAHGLLMSAGARRQP